MQVAGARPAEGTLADVVLVDAPCSGVGSLRREPDLRWRLTPDTLAGYPARQGAILREAAAYVRPGGRLVYATCSPFRVEGEGVVEGFLGTDFEPVAPPEALPSCALAAAAGPWVRTWPDVHGGGAFFAAILRRRA